MTYTSGSTIVAADYNGFVSNDVGANLNDVWGLGGASLSSQYGYGQTELSTVSAAGSITATQWASLVNNLATMASHQGTTITSRSAPVAGNTINILAALNIDLSACRANRGNGAASGSQYTGWTGTNSKTTSTTGAFTLTFTNTVTFPSALSAKYFWNAGGLVKIQVGKSSTGQTGDPEWNDLASTLCGTLWICGRVSFSSTQVIAGVTYTGTNVIGGTGTPTTYLPNTGWYNLSAGGAATIVYKQYADSSPYTSNYIQHTLAKGSSSDTLVITTTWVNAEGDTISGGTAASGATVGTAPCTIVTYYPPSSTYLTNTWGTPSVAATTA